MPRLLLTDEYWSKLRPIMLDVGIYDKAGLRLTVEGILYRLRVGCPWRDLPPEFGFWNSVFKRFNDWSEKGKLNEIFSSLASASDTEWVFIYGSISKAHQHGSGARTGESSGIGKSVAGNTSKIHMVVDSYGLPIEFEITEGQVHDCKIAPEVVSRLTSFDYLVADKGYDSYVWLPM
jgi:transposase